MKDFGVSPEFASVVTAAHELKSPLVLMRQLALRVADGSLSKEEQLVCLEQLIVVSERSLRLASDLEKTGRLSVETLPLQPVNAAQLCETVVKDLQPLYQAYGRKIRLASRSVKPLAVAHPALLEQVVYHFADNALRYGHVDDEVKVSVRLRRQQKQLRIAVRDYGPSMTLREWRELRQLKAQQLTSRPLSSGLGIYIADQFSAAMAGKIGLIRHRDGATLFVDVPLSEQMSLL